MNKEGEFIPTTGEVIAVLGGSRFRIRCENGKEATVHLSSEFRNNRSPGRSSKRITLGSRLKVKLSAYDPENGIVVAIDRSSHQRTPPQGG